MVDIPENCQIDNIDAIVYSQIIGLLEESNYKAIPGNIEEVIFDYWELP